MNKIFLTFTEEAFKTNAKSVTYFGILFSIVSMVNVTSSNFLFANKL